MVSKRVRWPERRQVEMQILTNSVAVMIQQKLVPLKTIAQDGMRVRATFDGAENANDPLTASRR